MLNQKGASLVEILIAIIIIIDVIGSALILKNQLEKPKMEEQRAQMDEEPRTRTIIGEVKDNNHGCTVDAFCYLRITFGNQEAGTIYNFGNARFCLNDKAGEVGLNLVKGNRVEVFGEIIGTDTISTCDSNDYYIRKL